MKINRKYAIRKLAVGVASVSIGLFIANSVDADSFNVVKAVDSGYNRTESGQVDPSGGTRTLKPSEEVKAVPNGEKNFYSTVAFTTEAGLGSGTLINDDTIVTVAHNFVHLNTKNNPITVENNVNKSGDIHIATLPNGKQVKFSNDDVKYWNREGYVQGFKNDLAVIKLKNKFTGETGATLHNEVAQLSNGDRIHVFGFPKGKLIPILNGTVENVENYGANIMGVAYQGSAPGMSGGGLYNANGELIGVNQNGVEGLRSGGITFSKEQLDWIKSIARGENAQPVYLADEPHNDDKEELHPTHGKLLSNDESVVGIIGKLYEDGTYIMSKDKSNASNLYLDNNGGGVNTMFSSFPNDASLRNKVKRIEVDGKLSADYLMFASSYLDNIEEIDARGITLSNNATELPMFAGLLGNNKLNKLQIDPDLSLSKIKNASPIVSDAPNLKLTNEQVTQLLKNVAFESGNRLFNNVGIERLDLTSFDNSKLNNNGVLFKNLKGLKEIAFGDNFDFNKYVPTGQANSYFDTDLSTVEKVSFSKHTSDVFIKEWLKAVKENPNNTMKYIVWTDVKNTNMKQLFSITDVLSGNSTIPNSGVYTLAKKNADTHFYVDYYIQDENNKDQANFYKRLEVKKGEWKTGEKVEDYVYSQKVENEIVYNNKIYKLRGDSELLISDIHVFNKEVENTTSWNEDTVGTSLYFAGEDLAFDGKVFKQRLYYSPKRKSITEVFVDDKEDKLHQTDFGYNEEDYYLKDKYFSGYKNWEETPEKNQRPEYIEKNNKIYKFIKEEIIEDEESPIYKYRYKVLHENTIKEEITKVESKDVYVGDESRDRTSENIKTNGTTGITKTITTYKVDNDGNLTEEVTTPEKTEVVNNVIKVGTKPKVEYFIRDDVAIKKTTTYTVNSETGEVTEKVQENVIGRAKAKVKTTLIPSPRVYQKDSERELHMPDEVIQGEEGSSSVNITYTLNKETGELTENESEPTVKNPTPTIIKVAAKDKVVYSKKGVDIIKTTTTYNVNENNGEITSNTKEEVFKVDGLKDKVVVKDIEIPTVYLKDSNREKGKPNMIIEGELGKKTITTTYNVNSKTGDVFEEKISIDIKHPKDKRIYVPAKDKIEVETIPYTTTYEKDANRELGKANLIYEGENGSKTTVIKYTVNEKTGEITEERGRTLIREAQGKRILVPAKDKVEVVNKKDGKIIKKTTVYNVNPNTGKITEDIKEEVIADKGDSTTEENLTELKADLQKDTDGNILNVIKMGETPKDLAGYINTGKTELTKEGYKVYIYQKVETSKGEELPPVVENKDFVGGVKPDNAPSVENLPELKVAVIKDNEDNILDVVKAEEKPKDIPGYKNTGKTGTDKDGYKTYIYEKVKEDKQPVVEDKKEANLKENNNKEITKKDELPSTTAIPMFSTVSLLSAFGIRKRKNKK